MDRRASRSSIRDPTRRSPTLTTELTRKGIRFEDVRQLLITHIHLDHAGATGIDRREISRTSRCIVHERGAPHMIDPAKLLASAGRLYGQDMDRLWGDVKPVPAANITALEGGETLTVAGRELHVAYTPGHASHHVSYFDTASGLAFVGDTAGIRRGSGTYVMPPTPPPDIDIEAWRESEKKILAWEPDTLFLRTSARTTAPRQHLLAMFENIDDWSRIVRRLLADAALHDEDRQKRFMEEAFQESAARTGETEAADYTKAGGLNYS